MGVVWRTSILPSGGAGSSDLRVVVMGHRLAPPIPSLITSRPGWKATLGNVDEG